MNFSKLATALVVIFVVSIVALAGELLYVLWRRRSFRRHTSTPPPIPSGDQTPDFPSGDAATKEQLLYYFCFKPYARVDPSGTPDHKPDGSSPDDQVVDVFKLLEAHGPSRFLCTIKEEDKEDVETSDVDLCNKPATNKLCLQEGLQLSAGESGTEEEEAAVTVVGDGDAGDTKTEFSTPCNSPLFFTPAGSPSRDSTESEFVVLVHEPVNSDDR